MIESVVDLTYRGLSLGRRVKLTQVRPSTGYLEHGAPMPVGTHVVVAADDGVAFDAAVIAVHEQVAGSDRPAGMLVAPALATAAAAAWWQARIALPDEDRAKPRPGRNRPVTVRPRSHTQPAPRADAVAQDAPAIIADLEARVAAAAGVAPGIPARSGPPPAEDAAGEAAAEHPVIDDGNQTVIMASVDPAALGLASPEDGGAAPRDDHGDDGAAKDRPR